MQANEPIVDAQESLPLNFLRLYPFPAWVAAPPRDAMSKARKGGLSLEPAWSNPAFDTLFGSHESLITALGGPGEQLLAYGAWLEVQQAQTKTLLLSLALPASDIDASNIVKFELELAKTVVTAADGRDYVVCTSISRNVLPDTYASAPATSHGSRKRRARPLKLRDLPTFRSSTGMSSAPGSSADSGSESTLHTRDLGPGGPRMVELMETFPWETTPLGPRDQWDVCLRQAADFTLNSPYPAAIWWGPDLVMIYNDAYAVMSTTKHPRIFGQNGMDAWGEIWDNLGPAMVECMKGNPVYRRDG